MEMHDQHDNECADSKECLRYRKTQRSVFDKLILEVWRCILAKFGLFIAYSILPRNFSCFSIPQKHFFVFSYNVNIPWNQYTHYHAGHAFPSWILKRILHQNPDDFTFLTAHNFFQIAVSQIQKVDLESAHQDASNNMRFIPVRHLKLGSFPC